MNIGLLIAGGSGARMQQDIPKQFLNINDKPVIVYTLEAFQKHEEVDAIAVVCIEGWETVLEAYARQFEITKLKHIIPAGENGQSSIRNGVFEIQKKYRDEDIILVHDAIRPLVSEEIISDCISKTKQFGSAITCIPCAEAMLETSNQVSAEASYPRGNLKRTQTPQGFSVKRLYDMHTEALEKGITDSVASCTLAIELGQEVYFSVGSEKNIKLTTVEDLDIFKALLASSRSEWLKQGI